MTGKKKSTIQGRGGIGDQAPIAEKPAEIEKILAEKEKASKSQNPEK